jgi:predicted transposase YbfD/YdcC
MAAANIRVNKLSVLELLKTGQEVPFLIPEYQRPYSWGDDEVITLFDDLWEFSIDRTQEGGARSYFLGSIVSYKENEVSQIIDGQQRLTSLFLLLRAIFKNLESEENKTAEVTNFISKIKPALWKENEMTGLEDRGQMLLTSDVVSDSGNEILRRILERGETLPNATDNYSRNYNKFAELYEIKAKHSPNQIYHFINAVLNHTILLPIDADDQETALTIFNTLNNRGLPLSDADIFKSYLYKRLDDEGKSDFIRKWKELESDAADVGESIQSLFYYHMFYIRAKEGDEKTTTPGVRKYFLEKNKNRLTEDVIDELAESLHLWKVVKGRAIIEDEPWSKNMDIRKILDCLSSYTNEFWKYPVSIYYMRYKDTEEFETLFLKFLRKFLVMLITRFMERPTVSAVKGDILKLNVQIINSCHPEFAAGFDEKNLDDEYAQQAESVRTDNLIIRPHARIERMVMKLWAYSCEDQEGLLPPYWEIEHIFPQTWDTKYYTLGDEEISDKLHHIGNKLPLEKKLNISASNNYFFKKKEKYKESQIAISKKLGQSSLEDWDMDNVDTNDERICKTMKALFKKWVEGYEPANILESDKPVPTEEELAMIKMLKEKGLI